MQALPKLRLGLALGSGGARGWAHIGALRALSKLGIKPDVICGTSMGALVGAYYLTDHLEELEDWAKRLTLLRMVRFLNFRIVRNGFIAGHRLFGEMDRTIGDLRFEDMPVPFAVIGTDLHSGHEIWFTHGPLVPAVRASFSLPAFFDPVWIENRWVIDGAMVNPVPVSVCHALGAQVVIGINLNVSPPLRSSGPRAAGANDAAFSALPAWTGTILRGGNTKNLETRDSAIRDPDAPSLFGVLSSTLNIVQDRVTRARMAADPPDVQILPKVGHIGILDFHTAAECIAAGETAIYQAEKELRDVMSVAEAFAP